MEANLLDGTESTNYNDHKDIKLKKRGRPKKVKESVPEPTQEEIYLKWISDNRVEFFNYNQKSNEFISMVYEIYNWTWNSNKVPGGCGKCRWNIIEAVKKRYV